MKTIYLHIGTDKAGSTAIQYFLKMNRDKLDKQGYYFPRAGNFGNHHGALKFSIDAGRDDILTELGEELKSKSYPNYYISHEGLYSLPKASVTKLVDALSEYKLIPVIYIRRRSDKARSGFAQRMKIDPFGETDPQIFSGKFNLDNKRLDYKEIIETWENAISNAATGSHIKVRIFEKSSFLNKSLIEDFLDAVGIFIENGSLEDAGWNEYPGEVNISIGPTSQYCMTLFRALNFSEFQLRNIMNALRIVQPKNEIKKTIIPDNLAKALDKKYKSDDRWIARKYFDRDVLFQDSMQFKYAKPDFEDFVKLMKLLYDNKLNFELVAWAGERSVIDSLVDEQKCRLKRGAENGSVWEEIQIGLDEQVRCKPQVKVHIKFAPRLGPQKVVIVSSTGRELAMASGDISVGLVDLINDEGHFEMRCQVVGGRGRIVKEIAVIHD